MRRPLALAFVLAATVAGTVTPASAAVDDPRDCLREVAGLDLQTVTIKQLQAAMADGRLTSAQLVDAYLARIEAFDRSGPALNAVRELAPDARAQAEALDAERARTGSRGPLHGIPVLLKDNVATKDLPTTAGAEVLRGARSRRDATIAARLRDAGAIVLGKLNLSEFAGWVDLSAPPGWSSIAGQVINANDFGSPSGSSSGSGVAASMAFAAATIGTETSGSILSPSDANGVVGLKTTVGMASRAGILPLAPSFDVPGPMVRSVEDAAVVLSAIAGPDPLDPETARAPEGRDFTRGLSADALDGVTLAYSASTRSGLSAARRALFDRALDTMRALGATIRPTDELDNSEVGLAEIAAIPNEFKASLNEYLPSWLPGAGAQSLDEVVLYAAQHSAKYRYGYKLLAASDTQPGSSAIFPALAEPTRIAARAVIDGALEATGAEAIVVPGNAHANIGAAAGYPTALTVLGYTGQRPAGIGFLGRAFSEAQLLAFAHAYETATQARRAPSEVNDELESPACA